MTLAAIACLAVFAAFIVFTAALNIAQRRALSRLSPDHRRRYLEKERRYMSIW